MIKIDYYSRCMFGDHKPKVDSVMGNTEFYDSELEQAIAEIRKKYGSKKRTIKGEEGYVLDRGIIVVRVSQPRMTLQSKDEDGLVLLMRDAGLIRGMEQVEEVK